MLRPENSYHAVRYKVLQSLLLTLQKGSVVQVTANCVVRKHTINDTITIEFEKYPGKGVYDELKKRGFQKVSTRGEIVWWAKMTDERYNFALAVCKGREEAGKMKPVEKAETAARAEKADDIDDAKLLLAAQRAAQGVKISYDNLDQTLKDKIESTRLVKFDLPPLPTVAFNEETLDPQYKRIVDDIYRGSNVFLVGGAGTGKTFLAKKIATDMFGRKTYTINCSQWTSPVEIIGGQTIEGYQEGKLIRAWNEGAILILDEMPKLDPNTAGLLNDALSEAQKPDPRQSIIENARGEKFERNPNFGCIATGNVYPNTTSIAYGANNKQDLSLLDRFAGSTYWIEADPTIEKGWLGNNMIWSLCNKIREIIETRRYESQVSRRFMQTCRNAYIAEMHRIKEKNVQAANDGHNLKSCIDSFMKTFNASQKQVIESAIDYSTKIELYQYRKFDVNKEVWS